MKVIKYFTTILFVLSSFSVHATDITQTLEARLTSTYSIITAELANLTTEQQAQDLVTRQLVPIIDTEAAARLALGKYWRRLDSTQQQRFIKALTTFQVKAYSKFLLDPNATTSTFEIVRSTLNDNGKTITVYTHFIVGPQTTNVDFRFLLRNGDWKVYDVVVEGVSVVMSLRSAFAAEFRQFGPEKMIENLEEKASR